MLFSFVFVICIPVIESLSCQQLPLNKLHVLYFFFRFISGFSQLFRVFPPLYIRETNCLFPQMLINTYINIQNKSRFTRNVKIWYRVYGIWYTVISISKKNLKITITLKKSENDNNSFHLGTQTEQHWELFYNIMRKVKEITTKNQHPARLTRPLAFAGRSGNTELSGNTATEELLQEM